MMIRKLELFHIDVPLKARVKHASHDRTSSDNFVAKITLQDGSIGYGEGVPRSYVTGETIESTFECLSKIDVAKQIGVAHSYDDVVSRLDALTLPETIADPRGMAGNSARCALEIAVLDAYGRHFQRALGEGIRSLEIPGVDWTYKPQRVRYSGAITAATPRKERISAVKLRIYGFHQTKVKVGVDGQDDSKRLHLIRKILGRAMDIRIDANEAWPASEVIERVEPLLRDHPSVLEQPVPHGEVETLAGLRGRLGMPIMLDESLCGYPDAVQAIEHGTTDFFNVRLSKCGGILPSLKIIGLGRKSGLGIQLGCHPGETGILSAAGRHVASNLRGLKFVEGSYDRHILARNVTVEDPTFRYGGWAPALRGPGLGVTVDPEQIARISRRYKEIVYD